MRSGGPGGQHANRTATAVVLHHLATGITAACRDHREGAANLAGALRRLRLRLACSLRGGADPAWLAALVRRQRLACGPASRQWPLAAAVMLDALAAADGSLAEAARRCALSTTQLARALAADREVRAAADAIRAAQGLSRLRA